MACRFLDPERINVTMKTCFLPEIPVPGVQQRLDLSPPPDYDHLIDPGEVAAASGRGAEQGPAVTATARLCGDSRRHPGVCS